MRRSLVWMLLIPCILLGGARVAYAQTPPGLQTVTGSGGAYQLQIPSDWAPLARSLHAEEQSLSIDIDQAFASPDGAQRLIVEIASGPGAARLAAPTNLLAIMAAYEASYQESESGAGSSNFDVFDGPARAEIANADIGMRASAVYADPDGNPRVLSLTVAGQGRSAFFFFVDVTESFYESDPDLGAILDSIALAPSTSGIPTTGTPPP